MGPNEMTGVLIRRNQGTDNTDQGATVKKTQGEQLFTGLKEREPSE